MKTCATCQRQYADSLQYCLEDGTVLTHLTDPQATLRLDTRPTQSNPIRTERRVAWRFFALAGTALAGVIGMVALGIFLYSWSGTNSNNENRQGGPSVATINTGQPASNPTKTDAQRELDQVNSDVGVALVRSDVPKLDRLLADDYRWVGDQGLSLTKGDVLTLYNTGNLSYEYLTTADPKIEVSDDLTKGVVAGHAKSRGQLRRVPFVDSYFYRNSYEKRQGLWQLINGVSWH